eukprot:m.109418 g.109418  ORF g.109418 m.109418 type:complete len:273 (-) comp27956_c1_seq2:199-1017(-)
MPLITLCGFPSSGKTTIAKKLAEAITKQGLKVEVVSELELGFNPHETSHLSSLEKNSRAALKAAVERKLNRSTFVIVDGLNYIKGYRYELYCIARALSTPSCVVHVATSDSIAAEWNEAREDSYTKELLAALIQRFECPDNRQRWEAPLFTIAFDEEPPIEAIMEALSAKHSKKPHKATANLPLAAPNSLHDIERITQTIVSTLMKAQSTAMAGDMVCVPETDEKVKITSTFTMSELRRIRRQFTTYTKTHPIQDQSQVAKIFVQFLNNTLT